MKRIIEIQQKDIEKVRNICENMKASINNLITLNISIPAKLLSVYGEFLVIYNLLLKTGFGVRYMGAHADIDLELIETNKKIEVKTSTVKRGMFHNGYTAKQKDKFDYLVLVGIDTENISRERFYIFDKEESKNFEKHPPLKPIYWGGKQLYMIYIFVREKDRRQEFGDFTIEVNKHIKNFEDVWDKIIRK